MSDNPTTVAIENIRSMLMMQGYIKILDWLNNTDFFDAPASTLYHGAWEGGLAEHSYQVYLMLTKFTESGLVTWERPESPLIIGLLHDVCKIGNYEKWLDGDNVMRYRYKREFFRNPVNQAHGSLSVKLIREHGLKLTDQEHMCIWYHMGTWTKDIDEQLGDYSYTKAVSKYPAVLWTHTADMYASQVMGI